MTTKQVIEYDVRTIDENGDVQDIDSFHGIGSKQRAMAHALWLLKDGATVVVERVTWTTDEDEDNALDKEHERLWFGGDNRRLLAGGWITEGEAA